MIIARLVGYAVAAASLVLNYFVFYYVAKFFGSTIPEFIAGAMTMALFFHELAHLLAYEALGIPSLMVFLVVLGGAAPMPFKSALDKARELNWEKESTVTLAGVVGNFLFIGGAYMLWFIGYGSWDYFLRITNLNALLIMWNLFPLWKFDGGQFTRKLFDSISESRDTRYEMAITLVFGAVSLILLILTGNVDPFNLIFLFWGLHYRANHDDPDGCYDERAIPEHRQKYWAAFYLIMLSAGVVMVALTPSWLANPK